MKHFGIIQTFNQARGSGVIKPESGGNDLTFDRNSFASWRVDTPQVQRRVSYEY